MSPDDFENPDNEVENKDANLVAKQQVYLDHLLRHSIKSEPTRAEFLMLFGALLESKIKSKIKAELNGNCLTYFLEFPTLIARSHPHKIFENDNPFTKNTRAQPNYEQILESIKSKISKSSLGEFVLNCNTYNSPGSIFNVLSDFSLVENYYSIHNQSGFDLCENPIRNFLKKRNELIHNLIKMDLSEEEAKNEIEEFRFIKKNLNKILNQIVLMVPSALKVRRTSIDGIKSSKDVEEVNAQLLWLEKIIDNSKNKYKNNNSYGGKIYSVYVHQSEHGRFALKNSAERLKKKLEEGSNV